MSAFVLGFHDVDATDRLLVGGKGAQLGELSRLPEICVPDGFCITTKAFRSVAGSAPRLSALIDRLSELSPRNRDRIEPLSREIRRSIEATSIPADVTREVTDALSRFDGGTAFAVRSSATAEDSPATSFAGQHDTYLNIVGNEAILERVRKCWASIFTDRAVTYRLQQGIDHRAALLAVVVQRMVSPWASGVLFTADPLTSHRKVSAIEAVFGLAEALVSGTTNADIYRVQSGTIIKRTVPAKPVATYSAADGGTEERAVAPGQRHTQVLTDAQILQLERIGREIEARFGRPQDIEWCLDDAGFAIVQSRPITTLYPIPEAPDDANRVYLSVGYQQMMTDAIKPLGLSFFLLTTRAPMRTAGGRLFVDITQNLSSAAGRTSLIDVLGQSDPLLRDALQTVVAREGFIPLSSEGADVPPQGNHMAGMSPEYLAEFERNTGLVPALIAQWQASNEELQRSIQMKTGVALLDFIKADVAQLQKLLFNPESSGAIRVGIYALAWINDKILEWLGEKNAADTLSQAVPNNVTAEMGLDLLDVADAVRPYPAVVRFLETATGDEALEQLAEVPGGRQVHDALRAYLEKYGMRCGGEIDITRERWAERPAVLFPMILSNVRNFEPGAANRRVEQGRREAAEREQQILDRLRQLPGGARKAGETQRMIALMRSLAGYREYPKYGMISRYFVYKQALLAQAERLIQAGVISEREDIFYLTLAELRDVIARQELDGRIIDERKAEYAVYERLTPPRVLTSDGEVIAGHYKREHLPSGSLPGLAVSSGLVEGRARVVLRMEDADLTEGDILVTAYTDPSWTPLFVSIGGLITEVGGLMTHGAVIAREYGIPAVVGVQEATRLIADGQRIRVHGTEGYIEILSGPQQSRRKPRRDSTREALSRPISTLESFHDL